MEGPIFTDKNTAPTEAAIGEALGKTTPLWKAFFDHLGASHPDLTPEWRYYNDGKAWLMKVSHKAKTVCWVTVTAKAFKTTFYFGDKAEGAVLASSISDALKDDFRNGKRYGKIRAITVTMKSRKDLDQAQRLVALRKAIK